MKEVDTICFPVNKTHLISTSVDDVDVLKRSCFVNKTHLISTSVDNPASRIALRKSIRLI